MNVFDDLVNELKEEDLLEEAVSSDDKGSDVTEAPQQKAPSPPVKKRNQPPQTRKAAVPPSPSKPSESRRAEAEAAKAEYFKKRAMDEVSYLQMVEHVISGVEREQMKMVSPPFDDLRVKKLLHEYVKISGANDLERQAEFEFQLLEETEAWHNALAERDARITIGHLRRFCETTRPALSSPALVSVARFYRNSPFSEAVRNKFELVITRVFTKGTGTDKRELVFSHDEIVEHIKGLYAEWNSVAMYPEDDDDPEGLLLAIKFQDFVNTAECAEEFRDLVQDDFFKKLRNFKASTKERFLAPVIVAAAVECNVRIGNRYADLVVLEKEKANRKIRDEQNGVIIEKVVSEVTTKTSELVDILDKKGAHPKEEGKSLDESAKEAIQAVKESEIFSQLSDPERVGSVFRINRWLIAIAALTLVATLGLYAWVEMSGAGGTTNENVAQVQLGGSGLDQYYKAPRVSNGILYAVVTEKWDALSKEQKRELLENTVELGETLDYSKVHLFNSAGKTVGAAHGDKVSVRDMK